MSRLRIACVLALLPLTVAAQPTLIVLEPGQSVEISCTGVWGIITTSPDVTAECVADEPPPPPSNLRVVDHEAIQLFESIPPQWLAAASDLRVLMRHASVGNNISEGLGCLRNNAPNYCRTGFGVPTSAVPVVDAPQYDRTNWLFEFRGNPGWYGKVTDLLTQVDTRHGDFNVITWKQSYVDGTDITQFWTSGSQPDVFDIQARQTAHPLLRILWWTAALAKVPMAHIRTFNDTMRTYTAAEDQPLFDLADILSTEPDGTPCQTDGIPIICTLYNNEVNGGHLTNGLGKTRVAKAFWVMMARLAGWVPA